MILGTPLYFLFGVSGLLIDVILGWAIFEYFSKDAKIEFAESKIATKQDTNDDKLS